MKTPSQTFDINRLGLCLRREVALNWHSWLLKLLILTATITFLLYINTKPDWAHNEQIGNQPELISQYDFGQVGGSSMVFAFCAYLVCALGAAALASNMSAKGSRLETLMTPASSLEKYVARWILYVAGVIAVFFISFTIAEFLRILLIHFFYADTSGVRFVSPIESMTFEETWIFIFAMLLAIQATYALGSTVAAKNSFLKTTGVLIVASILINYFTLRVYLMTRPEGCWWVSANGLLLVWNSFKAGCICWTIFCYITAYYRLKESEIIERL